MPHATVHAVAARPRRRREPDTVIDGERGAYLTARLARMLTGSAAHGIGLGRTAVLHTATGSAWPETRLLCEEFMLHCCATAACGPCIQCGPGT
ncbi:hypothetical protein [Streptomyces sp. NPDC020996]|uniref:hypothetical protein n=1 Tax=Streptomyces sp. NPDC020996 TaxID=3154791 RepID=UPI0033FA71AD